jgi:glycosyltransferase involved in cell wall biosynthesis
VTSELPWPLDSGGHLRTFHLLAFLSKSFHVTLVTRATAAASLEAFGRAGITVRTTLLEETSRSSQIRRALTSAVRHEPYVMYGRHRHGSVRELLVREVERVQPDIVYLDHLDSYSYAPIAPDAQVVCDLHNVYSLLVARSAPEQRHVWKRAYLAREARLLSEVERRLSATADLLFTVSTQEARYFEGVGARRVAVVPNGVDCEKYQVAPIGRGSGVPTMLYLGSMSWGPNVAAARFLATEVLPAVRQAIPDVRLQIVGRDPLPEVKELQTRPGVEVTGGVPDVVPYLLGADILAVPLDAGGGTRLKILEAFAAGLPVVSTPVGSEGLEVIPDVHLRVSSRAQFAETITALLRDPAAGAQMAGQARRLARDVYDWQEVGRHAVDAINEVYGARQH